MRGGSVYFTTETGEELDITGQFSEAEPYVYSYTASDGSAHDIVIGGSLEDYGYMEMCIRDRNTAFSLPMI